MFEASLPADKLKVIAKTTTLVDDGTFIANNEKIILNEMSPGKVAMIDLEVPAEFFDKYSCDGEVAFRIDLAKLRKVVNRLKSENVTLQLDKENNRFRIIAKGVFERFFELPLLSEENTERKTTKIPSLANITLDPSVLKTAIQDIKQFSDFAEFIADKHSLVIQGYNYNHEVGTRILENDDCVISYNVAEQCKALYPVNFLEDFIKVDGEMAAIAFATDMPLKLEYALPDNAKVTYYLAPRREQ